MKFLVAEIRFVSKGSSHAEFSSTCEQPSWRAENNAIASVTF
jgi:hypothetical protein